MSSTAACSTATHASRRQRDGVKTQPSEKHAAQVGNAAPERHKETRRQQAVVRTPDAALDVARAVKHPAEVTEQAEVDALQAPAPRRVLGAGRLIGQRAEGIAVGLRRVRHCAPKHALRSGPIRNECYQPRTDVRWRLPEKEAKVRVEMRR